MSESEQEKRCRRIAFIEDRIRSEFGPVTFSPGTISSRFVDVALACIMEDEALSAVGEPDPELDAAAEKLAACLNMTVPKAKAEIEDAMKPADGGSPRVILGKESSGTEVFSYSAGGVTRTAIRDGDAKKWTFTHEYGRDDRPHVEVFRADIKYTVEEVQAAAAAPQRPIRYNNVALVDKPPHPAMTIHRPPCPDCAHTEHPGRYVGIDTDEACQTCGGGASV